ncbi:hypothetical protein CC85DRAFT_13656 [Cutaneotrichosporon oleaginosum]|uniref:Uncharacterized protein n=1 Tax=Cutaneotrichosporon oleaginosum TaxID=879819 RepID=A0A0J1AU46_9TREE|nr:uncharacterized protein CC85DRAFT_13656 [Cutaneotrichosporon oleaginosum]KLT38829.1 hypothetical protein CC85DRAFT_13656 [Cutaneotrichosporon oleaginosum]TXT04727.1 hypothetical protein COLE_07546 [Cutaneotrichosporon oleaginosum]
MGAKQSVPVEDESYGIAEMFDAPNKRSTPFLGRIADKLPLTRRFATRRYPTTTRHAGLDSLDSIGEMRSALSAMGGWNEHHEREVIRPTGRARQLQRQRQRRQQRKAGECSEERKRADSRRRRRLTMSTLEETSDEGLQGFESSSDSCSSPVSSSSHACVHVPLPSSSMAPLPDSALKAAFPTFVIEVARSHVVVSSSPDQHTPLRWMPRTSI